MTTIREKAQAYTPQHTKNISEIEKVPVDAVISVNSGTTKDGTPFEYYETELLGDRYRVPTSVLAQIKELLAENPNLSFVKVRKSGTGMNTQYMVIPLYEGVNPAPARPDMTQATTSQPMTGEHSVPPHIQQFNQNLGQ